jgi:hypothetical protein
MLRGTRRMLRSSHGRRTEAVTIAMTAVRANMRRKSTVGEM